MIFFSGLKKMPHSWPVLRCACNMVRLELAKLQDDLYEGFEEQKCIEKWDETTRHTARSIIRTEALTNMSAFNSPEENARSIRVLQCVYTLLMRESYRVKENHDMLRIVDTRIPIMFDEEGILHQAQTLVLLDCPSAFK